MGDSFDLATIGATDAVYQDFQPYESRGLTLGRVSIIHGDRYRLYTAQGEMQGEAIGALLYRVERSEWPAVGDWVAVERTGQDQAMVHGILPRRTVISRRAAGDREQRQVLAVNIDLLLIVCGLDQDFNLRRIERYVTLAHSSGAHPVIVLNKSDVCTDLSARIEATRTIAGEAPVVSITACSAQGIEPVRRLLGPGLTIALLGSSGAGKSTLANQLLGVERQQVQEVRESDSRGRHTTTHRELLPLPNGGALIDTPGMRELQLWSGPESLDTAFAEIIAFARQCRFRDCSHNVEEGCAVQAAILAGQLDISRWQSYKKLRGEIARHEQQIDSQAAQVQKQRWKKIHKAMRVDYKNDQGGE